MEQLIVLLSAIAGSGSASAVAWYFIKRALEDLEEISKKIVEIEVKLSILIFKLDHSDRTNYEQEKKIAVIESEVHSKLRSRK